jgi:hypothetical protein
VAGSGTGGTTLKTPLLEGFFVFIVYIVKTKANNIKRFTQFNITISEKKNNRN